MTLLEETSATVSLNQHRYRVKLNTGDHSQEFITHTREMITKQMFRKNCILDLIYFIPKNVMYEHTDFIICKLLNQ
jgi:hypothetical protein